jgi:hypothetical protein
VPASPPRPSVAADMDMVKIFGRPNGLPKGFVYGPLGGSTDLHLRFPAKSKILYVSSKNL